MRKITMGADVETFATHGGEVVSAIGRIGGSKHRPLWVENGNLQEDNVLAEFAILPVSNEEEWVRNIHSVVRQLQEKLASHGLGYAVQSSHIMSNKWLRHRKAREFGCDPDYNAYTLGANDAPLPEQVGALRTAGGHIHIGFEEEDKFMFGVEVVRWMDVFLGVPSVLLDRDNRRRTMYGKAGAFRPKEYGIEYRVLSNFWIKEDKLMRWAYQQAQMAYHTASIGDVVEDHVDPAHLQHVINSGDVAGAHALASRFRVALPEVAYA